MKIALASDHAGYDLKKAVAAYLASRDIAFADYGCSPDECPPGAKVDYPDYAARAAGAIVSGACDRGILVCGTGIGMALAANKFRGIRATPCWSELTADLSRRHNDSNCLTLGGRVLTQAAALAIVRVWLETEFEGGRHAARLDKVRRLEGGGAPGTPS